MALEKVAHLPFAYLVDKYRYDVFSGKLPTDQLNAKWWQAV
jgi:peptidyl-dipeptidase A